MKFQSVSLFGLLALTLVFVGCGDMDLFSTKAQSESTSSAKIVALNTTVSDYDATELSTHSKVPTYVTDCTQTGKGKVYEVGEGKAYANIGDVPIESLAAGDMLRIHWRKDAYHEKVLITAMGTKEQPVRICGVRGANGSLPVIDGKDATTRSKMKYPYTGDSTAQGNTNEGNTPGTQDRGLFTLSYGKRYEDKPRWIIVEGIEFNGAYRGQGSGKFRDEFNNLRTYTANAAAIYVERGEHLVFRGNIMTNSGDGFFIASNADEATTCRDITVEGNSIYGNGNVDSDRQHNSYSECFDTTFQYNYFGRERAGAIGNNLKDRGAGTIIRYNWFEGGAHMNDLVEHEDGGAKFHESPSYRTTHVYGNVYVNDQRKGDGGYILHYGGDNGNRDIYRKGTLYFHHNTVIIRSDDQSKRWATTLFDISTNDETIDARNNIFYTEGRSELYLFSKFGNLNLNNNFISAHHIESRNELTPDEVSEGLVKGTVSGDDTTLKENTKPGFVDSDNGNFHLAAGSACIDAGAGMNAAMASSQNVALEFVDISKSKTRAQTGSAADVGAFEF